MQTILSITEKVESVLVDRGVQGSISGFEVLFDEPAYLVQS